MSHDAESDSYYARSIPGLYVFASHIPGGAEAGASVKEQTARCTPVEPRDQAHANDRHATAAPADVDLYMCDTTLYMYSAEKNPGGQGSGEGTPS